jgi:DNA-binding winged helix-turn-helix (wHTH) protein
MLSHADGTIVPLAPKALKTLLVLVEQAGTVVSKSVLMEAVWPDSHVEETGLTRNISMLRQVLSDERERFIATVARVGYRFVVPVTRVVDDSDSFVSVSQLPAASASPSGPDKQLIVGREIEFTVLRRAFENASAGKGKLVAIAGEPGIGKTTIVNVFLQEISSQCVLGRGRCSERLGDAEPHLPVLEALDELSSDAASMALLRNTAPTWAKVVGAIGREQRDEPGVEAGPARSAERLMRELTLFLERASRSRPIVLFFDDIHWSDVSTVDVLVHLASRIARQRVLIVLTYRRHELAQASHPFVHARAAMLSRGELDELRLAPLTVENVREYVVWAFGNTEPNADLASLVFRSFGTPKATRYS